jgi:hypothetical protein
LDELVANGFIERTRSYTVGEKAKEYRIGEKLREMPLRHRWVHDDASLAAWNAIRGIKPGVEEEPDPVRDHLRWNALRFSIDETDWADGLSKAYDDDDDPYWLKRMYADVTLLAFTGEPWDMWGTYCEFGGRWHSIYSRTARWMRRSWRFNGERLWIVDAKCLQPLIQAILAAKDLGLWPDQEDCWAIAMADATMRVIAEEISRRPPSSPARCR